MTPLHELPDAVRDSAAPVCAGRSAGGAGDRVDGGVLRQTWGDFIVRVRHTAQGLRDKPAQRWAVLIDDRYDFVCALFALLLAGKHPVMPANSTPGHLAQLAHEFDATLTDLDGFAIHGDGGEAALSIDPDAPLTLFTSGSSGVPKAIHKTLAQFNAEVHTLEAQFGASIGRATVMASVPHHHIYGLLFTVFWPLAAARVFWREDLGEPALLRDALAAAGAPAVVISSPAHLARWPGLLDLAALQPPPCRFFSSGGPLAADAAQAYTLALGVAPTEVFGSTETGGIAWRRQSDGLAWRPMPGIEIARDDERALRVRSPHLDHEGWHRTDDAVDLLEDGRFMLTGRLDRVVKLDGKRVSLPEIEQQLGKHGFVKEAATVLLTKEDGGRERIGAVVVLSEAGATCLREAGRGALVKTLRLHLAEHFDAVVLPRHWRMRFALPVDARGKLAAAALAAQFDPSAGQPELLSELRTAHEWQFELRVPRDLIHFSGHFPGLPILPGVVQVDWVMRFAAQHLPFACQVASLEQLKFVAPVLPGAILTLTMTHEADRLRVYFNFTSAGQPCASGRILYREPACA